MDSNFYTKGLVINNINSLIYYYYLVQKKKLRLTIFKTSKNRDNLRFIFIYFHTFASDAKL